MKKIDSNALESVARALGLYGMGSPQTEFADGLLEQTIDALPLIRRGRTPGDSTGLFTAMIRNIHAGAGTISTTGRPFNPTFPISPYPNREELGRYFDVWLIGLSCHQISGAGTLQAAAFINPNDATIGWGIDSAGLAVTANQPQAVALWDSVIDETEVFGITEQGEPYVTVRQRMHSASQIRFSTTASDVATFELQINLGVYPIGTGQDAY